MPQYKEDLAWLLEIPMAFFDKITIPIRNRLIPHWLKAKHMGLSCRQVNYNLTNSPIHTCGIQWRYTHLGVLKRVCRHYHKGNCYRYAPKQNPRKKRFFGLIRGS